MDVDLLINILDAYKIYLQANEQHKKSSVEEFGKWLITTKLKNEELPNFNPSKNIAPHGIEAEISTLIICINRYSKLLIKEGLKNYPQLVSEDFTYLYSLMDVESMTKKQLIEKNVHEKPTGLEVIKRLLKHGLILEKNDEKDKRSKRVFLTEKGKDLFFSTIEQMNKIAIVVNGNLSIEEKLQLHYLLKKLEDFHKPFYLTHKTVSLDKLIEVIKN